jgi:hypothetical protein
LTANPSKLGYPLDLGSVDLLNDDYFAFNDEAQTISVFHQDENLPITEFNVVLLNILEQGVLWT